MEVADNNSAGSNFTCSIVTVDLSGAFRSRDDIPAIKQALLASLTAASRHQQHVDLVFCQQPAATSCGRPRVPHGYRSAGHQYAFIVYSRSRFVSSPLDTLTDECLEVCNGMRLSICRLTTCEDGGNDIELIAGSCCAEQRGPAMSGLSLFRHLVNVIYDVMLSRRRPVVIGCSNFAVTVEQLQESLERDGRGVLQCLCYSRDRSARRTLRANSFLLCSSPPLVVRKLRPFRCGRLYFNSAKWRDAEDLFYWDAMAATISVSLDELDFDFNRQLPSTFNCACSISDEQTGATNRSHLASALIKNQHCRLLTSFNKSKTYLPSSDSNNEYCYGHLRSPSRIWPAGSCNSDELRVQPDDHLPVYFMKKLCLCSPSKPRETPVRPFFRHYPSRSSSVRNKITVSSLHVNGKCGRPITGITENYHRSTSTACRRTALNTTKHSPKSSSAKQRSNLAYFQITSPPSGTDAQERIKNTQNYASRLTEVSIPPAASYPLHLHIGCDIIRQPATLKTASPTYIVESVTDLNTEESSSSRNCAITDPDGNGYSNVDEDEFSWQRRRLSIIEESDETNSANEVNADIS